MPTYRLNFTFFVRIAPIPVFIQQQPVLDNYLLSSLLGLTLTKNVWIYQGSVKSKKFLILPDKHFSNATSSRDTIHF